METNKAVEVSVERIFHYLGRMVMKPETVIAFGVLAFFVVILVNWILSVIVILMKPVLCVAIMTFFMRPDLAQAYIAEEHVLKILNLTKKILASAAVSFAKVLQKFCENLTGTTC